MRKIIYLIFTVVLLCSLTACKKNGNTDIQETSCMSSKILIRNTLDHELKSMGITWMPDKEDREWWIEIYHPIEMEKEYRYVLGNDDGRFRIWREQDPVKLDLILNDPHQLVDFESTHD